MKKAFIKITCYLFIITHFSCKELPPTVDFSEKTNNLKDETYLSSSNSLPINKTIFIEDITGVRCPNCPTAATKIQEIRNTHSGKVISMAVYPSALKGLMTPYSGFENLTIPEAD